MTKTVQKSKARDMTQGSIWKQLLLFSLPLMAGNLFQQLYNTVDSIVVGNFVGKEALAAVGSVGPIINSLIGFSWDFPPVPVSLSLSIMAQRRMKRSAAPSARHW